ncbi:MAG TPA: hypothetical protein IAC47_08075 [Candidatus Onthomorpha intestinigallinarum]|uniref:Lipoprotein n=1 Tax=Candidatus Onthomorpha intestinigallinarum TaxID=2840880 RepID=A0A9D1RIQ4_9BACT|nr:hypothetical protein [Candidatus Onthomorpha intestinigallinarum]
MKTCFLSVLMFLGIILLSSCADMSDCSCTYGDVTEDVMDWSGDCSSINVEDVFGSADSGDAFYCEEL